MQNKYLNKIVKNVCTQNLSLSKSKAVLTSENIQSKTLFDLKLKMLMYVVKLFFRLHERFIKFTKACEHLIFLINGF